MAEDSQTTIAGNLVDIPELRFTNNGIAVANLRVAVTLQIHQDGDREPSGPMPRESTCSSGDGRFARATG
jgi:single-stranded DNA-binding protein